MAMPTLPDLHRVFGKVEVLQKVGSLKDPLLRTNDAKVRTEYLKLSN